MSRITKDGQTSIGCDHPGCTSGIRLTVPGDAADELVERALRLAASEWFVERGGLSARCPRHRHGSQTVVAIATPPEMPDQLAGLLATSGQELFTAAKVVATLPGRVVLLGYSQQVSPVIGEPVLDGNPRCAYVVAIDALAPALGPAAVAQLHRQHAAAARGHCVVVVVGPTDVWVTTMQMLVEPLRESARDPLPNAPGGRA